MYHGFMRSFGVFFPRSSQQQNADIVQNAIKICDQLASLEEAVDGIRNCLEGNRDFVRAVANSDETGESNLGGLLEKLTGMHYQLGSLQVALEQLRTQLRSDLREDYNQHQHREQGAQTVYRYYLGPLRDACPQEEDVRALSASLSAVDSNSLELDLSCLHMLQVTLDSIERLPDDLAQL